MVLIGMALTFDLTDDVFMLSEMYQPTVPLPIQSKGLHAPKRCLMLIYVQKAVIPPDFTAVNHVFRNNMNSVMSLNLSTPWVENKLSGLSLFLCFCFAATSSV